MKNFYLDQLESLMSVKLNSESAISIFVPLNSETFKPAQIFRSLEDAANRLLVKDGKEPVKIQVPVWTTWEAAEVSTIGIFYQKDTTTVVPLPITMQPRVVVASSFHLKPIIAAIDELTEGLHLHLDDKGASLYKINTLSSELVCRFGPSNPAIVFDHLEIISKDLKKSISPSTKILVVTGLVPRDTILSSGLSKLSIPVEIIENQVNLTSIRTYVRLRLYEELNTKRTHSVLKILKSKRSVEVPIEDLGRKILESEITHLCISLEDLQFGSLNPKTGYITVNKIQLSSRDDDLLDDLAEMAIKKGVKVTVVPKKFLPLGRTYLAS